jgi:hypothetical protein
LVIACFTVCFQAIYFGINVVREKLTVRFSKP